MEIINYSSYTKKQILELIPSDFIYDKLVVFPDISDVPWLLPTGIAVLTNDKNWRKFAVSNIGCGMLLCKSNILSKDFNKHTWDNFANELKENSDYIGDLNKGNHFVNAIVSDKDNLLSFIIHTGTFKDIQKLKKLSSYPKYFDEEHNRLVKEAKKID